MAVAAVDVQIGARAVFQLVVGGVLPIRTARCSFRSGCTDQIPDARKMGQLVFAACRIGDSAPPRLPLARYFFGRIATAVPWMKALIFSTWAAVSLPGKSGMPCAPSGPLNTYRSRLAITAAGE